MFSRNQATKGLLSMRLSETIRVNVEAVEAQILGDPTGHLFCSKCGRELVERVLPPISFDMKTGQPYPNIRRTCPMAIGFLARLIQALSDGKCQHDDVVVA